MTKPRDWFLMPEPFTVRFERPRVEFFDGFRMAYCRGCTFSASEDYGIRMGTHSHWCSSGENTLVIWEAL